MNYKVRLQTRAKNDVRTCFEFIASRSPKGAARWFNRFVETRDRLAKEADQCPLAYESDDLDREIREVLFKTRRGQPYRVVFTISGDEVIVLRVRGPGQNALSVEEIE